MQKFIIATIASLFAANIAFAAGPDCEAQAAKKKLAGAAKNSFMKKCEMTASASCESKAQKKKLAGAAKNSFMKKCTGDSAAAK